MTLCCINIFSLEFGAFCQEATVVADFFSCNRTSEVYELSWKPYRYLVHFVFLVAVPAAQEGVFFTL